MELPVIPTTTVREIVTTYPGSEQVFENHGLAGCGGDNGPTEPVAFFAAIHHVEPTVLIAELNAYITNLQPTVVQSGTLAPARLTYPLFVTTALVLTLAFGLTTGVAAALTDTYGALTGDGWLAMVQAHGHLQLFGFLGLFIMGMAYHVVPRFKGLGPLDGRLVLTSYALVAGGVLLRANTQPHAQQSLRWFMGASGPIELAGGILFAALIVWTLLRSRERREPGDRVIVAACGFMVLSLAMNAYQVLDAARAHVRVVDLAGDTATLEAAIHGFILLFVLGVSFRVLPFFMRLRPAHARLRDASLAALVVGVLARTAGLWAPDFTGASWAPDVVHAATLLEAAAILGFIRSIRVFEGLDPGTPEGASTPLFATIVRTAYAWLLIAVALELYWQLREFDGAVTPYYAAGALRHTVVAGFATLMIAAMAYRTIPVFSGRALAWPRAVPAVFGFLLAGAALRVFPVAFAPVPTRIDYYLLSFGGASLFLGLGILFAQLGSAMYGWGVRPTAVSATPEPASAAETPAVPPQAQAADPEPVPSRVRAGMTVAQALAIHPLVQDFLVRRGLAPLSNPQTRAAMAPTITVEGAAEVIGAAPARLVEELNTAITASMPAPEDGGLPPIYIDFSLSQASPQMAIAALKSCYDPEIPVNIVDLGLVYGIVVREGKARMTITLTSRGCPAGEAVQAETEDALLAVPGISEVEVDIVYDPPWGPARMSLVAKQALGWA